MFKIIFASSRPVLLSFTPVKEAECTEQQVVNYIISRLQFITTLHCTCIKMRRHPKVDAYAFRYHSIFHLTATHQTIATNEMERKIE